MKFHIPCRLSVQGHLDLGYHSHRTNGHVIGESRCKTCWWMSWDGHTPQSYAKVFIELITSNTNNNGTNESKDTGTSDQAAA